MKPWSFQKFCIVFDVSWLLSCPCESCETCQKEAVPLKVSILSSILSNYIGIIILMYIYIYLYIYIVWALFLSCFEFGDPKLRSLRWFSFKRLIVAIQTWSISCPRRKSACGWGPQEVPAGPCLAFQLQEKTSKESTWPPDHLQTLNKVSHKRWMTSLIHAYQCGSPSQKIRFDIMIQFLIIRTLKSQ